MLCATSVRVICGGVTTCTFLASGTMGSFSAVLNELMVVSGMFDGTTKSCALPAALCVDAQSFSMASSENDIVSEDEAGTSPTVPTASLLGCSTSGVPTL